MSSCIFWQNFLHIYFALFLFIKVKLCYRWLSNLCIVHGLACKHSELAINIVIASHLLRLLAQMKNTHFVLTGNVLQVFTVQFEIYTIIWKNTCFVLIGNVLQVFTVLSLRLNNHMEEYSFCTWVYFCTYHFIFLVPFYFVAITCELAR